MAKQEEERPSTLYDMVKRHVRAKIESGEWGPNDRLPSEVVLVEQLGVSRMTVHRALRELTLSGVLFRISGVGTFVSAEIPASIPLALRDISAEISAQGGAHSAEVVKLEEVLAEGEVARALEVKPGTKLYHSIIVHRENEKEVQLEERHILPVYAPNYLATDFTKETTFQHLWKISKPTAVEQYIYGVLAGEKNISELLSVGKNEPCLLLVRRTWVGDTVATFSRFYYPGSRYRLRDFHQS
jgi:GntR family histidine utilization transcriptional repressor